MKEIFLHIGYHKTGTSSLQETLHDGRDKLLNSGVWYPRSQLGFPAQQEIAWTIVKQPKPWMKVSGSADDIYSSILKQFEAKAVNAMILSSEDLTFIENDAQAMSFIKARFEDYAVKIVAYVRNPTDFLLSLYGHRLRSGQVTMPFMEYYSKNMRATIACFAQRLRHWENVFGVENMIVRKYDPKSFHGDNIASDFLHAIGLQDVELGQPQRSNESLHPWLSELFVRLAADDTMDTDKNILYKKLMSIAVDFPQIKAIDFYLTKRDRMILDGIHKDSNRKLLQQYGIRLD